jgi:signal transduction histidine kinase
MLDQLTTNSVEAGGDGTEINLATSVDSRGWVVLEVRDTGRGMPPEVLERAVEPFFSTKAGHLGVGLSIANGIWRRHKGTLAVRSRPGEGTTVRLCIEPVGGARARTVAIG